MFTAACLSTLGSFDALYPSTSAYGRDTVFWLAGTRWVGLRPCEWTSARRVGFALVVCIAKATPWRMGQLGP